MLVCEAGDEVGDDVCRDGTEAEEGSMTDGKEPVPKSMGFPEKISNRGG